MSKVFNFSKTQLDNPTHVKTMQRFADRLSAVTHPKLADAKSAFLTALAKEDSDFKKQTGSDITQLIADADLRRDRAYGSLSQVARAFAQGFGTKEQTDCAERLLRIVTTYKVDVNAQYDRESGVLDNFIKDVEAATLPLDTIGLANVFAELKTANTECDRLLDERDNERASQTVGVLKADRQQTDRTYDTLVDGINAVLWLDPTEALQQFAEQWNATLNRLRQQVLHSTTQTGDQVDYNPSEDNGTGTQQPVTPPSGGGVLE